ncbi:MAG: zf-HC2 domain-containing protein [Candidatus Aminicenantes bacterium]
MNCQRVEELLSMYIENELPGELHREVLLHLEECDQCRLLKDKIEELIYAFPDLEEEVPFFLENRLYYIPESQAVMEETRESKFFYLKWLAAAIGTFVLFLNLFYFTNIYPPAKRMLHSMVAGIKTFTVETGAFIDEVRASDGASLFSVFKKDPDTVLREDKEDRGQEDRNTNIENHKLEIEKQAIENKGGQNG